MKNSFSAFPGSVLFIVSLSAVIFVSFILYVAAENLLHFVGYLFVAVAKRECAHGVAHLFEPVFVAGEPENRVHEALAGL